VSELVGVDVADAGVGGGEFEVASESPLAHASSVDDPHELDRAVRAGVFEWSAASSVVGPFVEGCEGRFVDGDAAFGVQFAGSTR
jgi:hypothetical protein